MDVDVHVLFAAIAPFVVVTDATSEYLLTENRLEWYCASIASGNVLMCFGGLIGIIMSGRVEREVRSGIGLLVTFCGDPGFMCALALYDLTGDGASCCSYEHGAGMKPHQEL